MSLLRDQRPTLTYDWPSHRRPRRICKRFVRQSLKACDYDLTRAPMSVELKFNSKGVLKMTYLHDERRIRVPGGTIVDGQDDWEDEWIPTMIHEWGHVIDLQCLNFVQRSRFFEHATGLEANWSYDYAGSRIPAHMRMENGKPVERVATWYFSHRLRNVCETFADCFLTATSRYGIRHSAHAYRPNNSLVQICKEMLP